MGTRVCTRQHLSLSAPAQVGQDTVGLLVHEMLPALVFNTMWAGQLKPAQDGWPTKSGAFVVHGDLVEPIVGFSTGVVVAIEVGASVVGMLDIDPCGPGLGAGIEVGGPVGTIVIPCASGLAVVRGLGEG